jgi:hypothetical protein
MALLKGAFLAMAGPDSDPTEHRAVVANSMIELIVVFVKDRDEAVEVAQQLVDQGCGAIELCGGFGHAATAKIAEALKGKAAVGAVRFDFHPLLGMSADSVF